MDGTPVWWDIWRRQVPHSVTQYSAPLSLTALKRSAPTEAATSNFSYLKP